MPAPGAGVSEYKKLNSFSVLRKFPTGSAASNGRLTKTHEVILDQVPNETMRLLRAANWERLWLQCFYFAVREEKRYHSINYRSRDMVQTAIEKTFSGERKWKPEVCDLSHHLRMTIKSLYSNEFGRSQSQRRFAVISRSEITNVSDRSRSQEDIDFLRNAIRILKEHDPALAAFFISASRHLMTDCDNDREIAAAMNIAPSTVTKTKKRISNIIGSWNDRITREFAND